MMTAADFDDMSENANYNDEDEDDIDEQPPKYQRYE